MRFALSTRQWQIVLVSFSLIFCALFAVALNRSLGITEAGRLGFVGGDPEPGLVFPILAIQPDSTLADAGAKVGDRIVFDNLADRSRKRRRGKPSA